MNRKLALIRDFIVFPALEKKSWILSALVALLFLSGAHSALIFIIGPFLRVFFGAESNATLLKLSDIIPTSLHPIFPEIAAATISARSFAFGVPVIVLCAGTTKSLASFVYQYSQEVISLHIATALRQRCFYNIMSMSYQQSTAKSPAEWMSTIMNDVYLLQSKLSTVSASLLRDFFVIIACLATISVIHWQSGLAIITITPLIAYGLGKAGRRISDYTSRFQHALALIANAVLDLRRRFDFVRAQGGEEFELNKFTRLSRTCYHTIRRSLLLRSSFAPALEFIGFFLFAGFLIFHLHIHSIRSESGLVGQPEFIIQIFGALLIMLRPLRGIGEELNAMSEVRGAMVKALTIEKTYMPPPDQMTSGELLAKPKSNENIATPATIQIQKIRLCYGHTNCFVASNLLISRGQSLAIVGPSGSGKSSFVRALTGLLHPSEWQANLSWQQIPLLFGLVGQHPFFFAGSIRENLTYGIPTPSHPSDNLVWDTLDRLGLKHDISMVPGGLDGSVKMIHGGLSGGQLQRLCIARALILDRPYLALDEATSAVDPQTERIIFRGLFELVQKQGLGLIAITHRLQWLREFDHIWLVDNGAIIAQGTFSTLSTNDRFKAFASNHLIENGDAMKQ